MLQQCICLKPISSIRYFSSSKVVSGDTLTIQYFLFIEFVNNLVSSQDIILSCSIFGQLKLISRDCSSGINSAIFLKSPDSTSPIDKISFGVVFLTPTKIPGFGKPNLLTQP